MLTGEFAVTGGEGGSQSNKPQKAFAQGTPDYIAPESYARFFFELYSSMLIVCRILGLESAEAVDWVCRHVTVRYYADSRNSGLLV